MTLKLDKDIPSEILHSEMFSNLNFISEVQEF